MKEYLYDVDIVVAWRISESEDEDTGYDWECGLCNKTVEYIGEHLSGQHNITDAGEGQATCAEDVLIVRRTILSHTLGREKICIGV